jgi:SAM-dependent methyltransferase
MDFYHNHAKQLAEQYNATTFDDVHRCWLGHLPETAGLALDVGAGSGRDAKALAERGWSVYATEPAKDLRVLGEAHTAGLSVVWTADSLPELGSIHAAGLRFNLILISAVWMHLPPTVRERAMRKVSDLLAPDGLLVITLRHGPSSDERTFYEVSAAEVEHLARARALMPLPVQPSDDALNRQGVWWETVMLRLPDDGTGALPLLRHIIVNDNKSASYKLGLLRVLTRIAESLPGIVTLKSDDWVEIPLGIVGLYWLRLYLQLIVQHQLRQHPNTQRGYGFAGDAFYALGAYSTYDLAVGRRLEGEVASIFTSALGKACKNISDMPAKYITWPGTNKQVFEASYRAAGRSGDVIQIDKPTLLRFGTLRIPRHIWQSLGQYAGWLDPALTREWMTLMKDWNPGTTVDAIYQSLAWDEGIRNTSQVRRIIETRLSKHDSVRCVWSDSPIKDRFHVDHCFPWSRWMNNDLWNLMPASERANSQKSEKLPSQGLMLFAKDRIVDWWDNAYLLSPSREQFLLEATVALPGLDDSPTKMEIFQSTLLQRERLLRDQQLPEWRGIRGTVFGT